MEGKKLVDIADLEERDYRILLTPCAASVKLMLRQGWNFDRIEPQGSADDRMFIDLLFLVSEVYEDLNQVLSKIDPDNLKKMASLIERDLVSVAASLTTQAIVTDIGDELFSILVDNIESWDHLIVSLRYVDKRGSVTERVLGLVSDHDYTASSPKAGIYSLLNKHQLNVSKLRGQGCNEARSLYKRFNVVKDLIMEENKCAYSVNCFARELHLAIVEVSIEQTDVSMFFLYITYFLKAVGASSKHKDVLGDIKYENIVEGTPCGETMIGQGSYYGILMRLISSFSLVLEMLEDMDENVTTVHRFELNSFLRYMPCFEFAFLLFLMKDVLGITNDLSQALQRKYDLVNIMALVEVSKHGLEKMKDDGWGVSFDDVCSFSLEHDRFIPNMEDAYKNPWARRGRAAEEVTNFHHYRDELFNFIIYSQLQELNNRFSKEKMNLLLYSACFDPGNSFSAFNKARLIQFAEFYPSDFSETNILVLGDQLENYIYDVRSNSNFSELKGIDELAKRMVELKKDHVFPLVYLLVKLALILPIATPEVERTHSALELIKTSVRGWQPDGPNDLIKDSLVTYIERDILNTIDKEAMVKQYLITKPYYMLF